MKAFDSITHESIWDALKSCGIEHDYINFLKKLYRDQKATVLTESDMFEMKKGTKLGEPLSSLLFKHVSAESIGRKHSTLAEEKRNGNMPERQRSWLLHKHEICCRRAPICILKEQLQKMACEFKRSTGKVGLRIHSRKTKSQQPKLWTSEKKLRSMTSKSKYWQEKKVQKHLDQMITFQQQETTEIINRIRAAWATFHKNIKGLTSRTYMLGHRLRLFDAVVSPTMNYASGIWTLTKEHERMIQSTQRKTFD